MSIDERLMHPLLSTAHEFHETGQYREAEQQYQAYLKQDPDDPVANNLLGLLCLQTGRHQEAIEYISIALRGEKNDPRAHYNLGLALFLSGDKDAAALQFKRAAELEPDNPETLNAWGNTVRLLGRAGEAVAILESAAGLAPGHPGIILNLANAYIAVKRYDTALEMFNRLLSSDAENAGAHQGIAEVYLARMEYRQAVDALEVAEKLAPGNSRTANSLGVVCNKLNQVDAALGHFRTAVARDAGNAEALTNLGILLEQAGQRAEAAGCFLRAIAASPRFVPPRFHLAHLGSHRYSEDELAEMQSLAGTCDDARDRALLYYAIGKDLDRKKSYDRAFSAFAAAHQAQLAVSHYSPRDHAGYINALMHQFGKLEPIVFDHPGLVFIVGMPRSGTTLTEQILAGHPQIAARGETLIMPRLADRIARLTDRSFPQAIQDMTQGQLAECAHAAIDSYGADREQLVVDTTPDNYSLVGLICFLFPQAKIIHCRRDPMDTCLSIYQQPLSDAHAYAHRLETLGQHYRHYLELMNFWDSLPWVRMYDQVYEAVVREAENETGKMLDFLELPFDARCLEFHKLSRRIRTPSASRVRNPIDSSSIGRWKHYEMHLTSLVEALHPG